MVSRTTYDNPAPAKSLGTYVYGWARAVEPRARRLAVRDILHDMFFMIDSFLLHP
jgi:hypothetical protein